MTDQAIDDTTEPAASVLASQLAEEAQRRREEAQKEAQRENPDFILDVEQSEVLYTVPPRLLPLRYVDYGRLSRQLGEKWGLAIDSSGTRYDTLLVSHSREQIASMTEDEMMHSLLRSEQPDIMFRSGKYAVSDLDFVPIRLVRLNFESVLVSVAGVSRIAEAVAEEVFETISASAGAARSWRTIEPFVQRAGYATRTKVQLGVPFEAMLGPATQTFLKEEMVAGPNYASHLGLYYSHNGLGPAPQAMTTYALDDLVLHFAWFDPQTGTSAHSDIRFSVTSKGDFRSGIVSVSSELRYDIHVECLRRLTAALRASAG
jgi:hypothetical protein